MKSFFMLLLSMTFVLPLYSQHTDHLNRKIGQFENVPVKSRLVYFENICDRTTKIVLSGDNSMTDLLYKNAIQEGWYVSPFEFCTYEEFDKIKCDTNYYFLLRVISTSKVKNNPEMEFMTFVKGDQKAVDGIEKMPEILSLPIFPYDDKEGRIFAYLPAYVNIFQSYIGSVANGKYYPLSNNNIITKSVIKSSNTTVFFRKEDFAFPVTQEYLDKKFKGRAKLVSQEEIDDAISSERPNILVSLVVAHPELIKGTYCYKMLISTDSYDLYYYKKHKISKWKGAGFTKKDLRNIAILFKINRK